MLETHLEANKECATSYYNELKVDSVLAVMIIEFPCLNCSVMTNCKYLKPHLNQSPNCLTYYETKLGVKTIDEIMKKIKSIKRKRQPSRLSTNRRDYIRNQEPITVTQAINNYRKFVALANYRLCCICCGHYLESSTFEIKPEMTSFKELSIRFTNKSPLNTDG